MRALLATLALVGCDAVYGLDPRPVADAAIADAPSRICHDRTDSLFHDEDSDEIDDGCDVCPQFYEEGIPPDEDGDGVGDSCDPRPTITGDRIWFFDGFGGELRLDQRWTSSGGDWKQENGSLLYADVTTPTFNRVTSMMPAPPRTPYVLEMNFELDMIRTGTQSVFELATEIDADPARAIGCGISRDTANNDFVQLDNDYTQVNTKTPAPILMAQTYTVRFSYNPDGDSQCSIDNGGDIHHQASVVFADPNVEPRPFGMISRQMAVRVRWITIYARE